VKKVSPLRVWSKWRKNHVAQIRQAAAQMDESQ
jgi:hypothetical protein